MSHYMSEYREAFDPETRATRPTRAPRSDVHGIRAQHRDTPEPAKPKLNVSNEWSEAWASPIHTPDWTGTTPCPHHTIRETSIAGVLTNRECIDCGQPLPDREWDT